MSRLTLVVIRCGVQRFICTPPRGEPQFSVVSHSSTCLICDLQFVYVFVCVLLRFIVSRVGCPGKKKVGCRGQGGAKGGKGKGPDNDEESMGKEKKVGRDGEAGGEGEEGQ